MTEDEDAFELKRKAVEIIKKRGIFDSLNWIVAQRRLGLSDHLKVSPERSEKDFKDCQKYFSFKFNGHRYELFLENGHYFQTPDDTPYWGDVRLLFDNELVFKSKYENEFTDFGSEYRLITIDSVIDVLRLNEWVNDLPTLTEFEKEALAQTQEKIEAEDNAKEAERIKKNFDLGKFS
jgi:hypothetical protein